MVAILLMATEPFSRFWWRVTQGTLNYFEIRPLACKDMSFKGFSISSTGGHFVQWRGTILAIYVQSHPSNISVNFFFCNWAIGLGGDVKDFSIFSSGGHFVQQGITI